MTVRIWQTIDGTLDNVVSVQNQSGSPETAIRALRLRERGWEAAARHPDRDGDRDRGGLGWPPIDAMLEIPLSDADVSYLRGVVAEAIPVIQTIIELPTSDASSRRTQEESLDLAQQALAVLDGLTRGAGVGDA